MSNYQKKLWKRGISGNTPILAEDLNKYEDYLFMHDQQIENLTHIPEGSTTADLEVIDGRVGYDGEIFNSLGDAIRGQIEDVYDRMGHPIYPKGTISFENLPNFDVVTVGDMYNISNDFTTDNRFVEGSGHNISAGANVYAIDTNGTMQWDLFAPVNNIVIDSAMSDRSENPVQNKVVKNAIDSLSSLTLKPQGNIVFANLPNDPETYDMYKVTDDFTTDNRFEETGKEVKAPIFIYFNGTKWVLFASSGGDTHIIGTRNQCISWATQGMIPDGSVCIFTDDYEASTPYVVGTQAQINAMLNQGLLGDGTVCVITDDYSADVNLAENVGYDNTTSGLSADDVQGAIDEVVGDLSMLDNCSDVITNLLLVSSGFPKDTTPKAIRTNDATTLTNSPITSGYFYGFRELLVVDSTHFIVRITEIYPTPCRIWMNVYNNTEWKGWKSITLS